MRVRGSTPDGAALPPIPEHLHSAFNGTPSDLDAAVGDMFTLKDEAAAVMAIELGDGTNTGPTFDYVPAT